MSNYRVYKCPDCGEFRDGDDFMLPEPKDPKQTTLLCDQCCIARDSIVDRNLYVELNIGEEGWE